MVKMFLKTRFLRGFFLIPVICGCLAVVRGQTPTPEGRVTAGSAGFLDEQIVDHFLLGAAIRLPFSRRWSVEPEFRYLRESERDQDYLFLGSLIYDFRDRGKRVVPYVMGTIGAIHTRFNFGGPAKFSHTELTGSGGAGVRIYAGPRLFLAPEVRFGTEPLFQFTGSIGWTFD